MSLNKTKIFAVADKYISKGSYDKALVELLKVAKTTPQDTNLLNKIGDLYSKIGNNQNAIAYFQRVAESYVRSGFNLKAIAVFKKIIRIDPNFMEARDQVIELYLQLGHQSEARGELRRMADQFYSDNLFPRALASYQKLVEIDPSNLDARLKIAEILVREGKRDEAAGHFAGMGRDLLQKGMVNEAFKMVSQGLKLEPNNAQLLMLLAQIYISEGKTDEALHQLTDLCRKSDRNIDALELLGRTYLGRNQLREAKACFQRAFHLEVTHVASLEGLAQRFIQINDLDEAHSTLAPVADYMTANSKAEEAIRLIRLVLYANENHIQSLQSLAETYQKVGQFANAILTRERMINFLLSQGLNETAADKIRELLALDPNNLEWRSRLESLERSAHAQEEITDFSFNEKTDTNVNHSFGSFTDPNVSSGGLSLEPSDRASKIANHLTEAEVFMKYGILDQALEHLMQVRELDPFNYTANNKLKQLYLERGEVDKALQCMAGMINACIEKNELHQALEIIREINEHRPDIAQLQRGRIESLLSQEAAQKAEDNKAAFGFDFQNAPAPVPRDLFEMPSSADVVDFSQLPSRDDSFHLDFDDSIAAPNLNRAKDLADIYSLEDSLNLEPAILNRGPAHPSSEAETGELPMVVELPDAYQSSPQDRVTDEITDISDLEILAEEEAHTDFESYEDLESLDEDDLEEVQELEEIQAPAVMPAQTALQDAQAAGARSLASELEEIDFFISVEAYEDARHLLIEAQKHFGDHPLIMERLQEVDSHTNRSSGQRLSLAGAPGESSDSDLLDKDSGFFDLAAELSEELFEESAEVNDKTGQEEIQSVEELFEEFKKGVSEQISEDDFETHYDLGIAYKEMGLLEEAIYEFRKANSLRERFLECTTLIGHCLTELGRIEEAIKIYEAAINRKDLSSEEDLALRYDLAIATNGAGDSERALAIFNQIEEIEPGYRDVPDWIEALV